MIYYKAKRSGVLPRTEFYFLHAETQRAAAADGKHASQRAAEYLAGREKMKP